ncbi:hypothetical protein TIFTF001_020947 [Ficus carica]|uniref:Uncharacterized protein n=1 Tax=Ficus carica TaxID=3494 RepID=A0AA88A9K4_FICCA|nr:hypothetical protein TIFTF001_020947 [Ficus carica]
MKRKSKAIFREERPVLPRENQIPAKKSQLMIGIFRRGKLGRENSRKFHEISVKSEIVRERDLRAEQGVGGG